MNRKLVFDVLKKSLLYLVCYHITFKIKGVLKVTAFPNTAVHYCRQWRNVILQYLLFSQNKSVKNATPALNKCAGSYAALLVIMLKSEFLAKYAIMQNTMFSYQLAIASCRF